METMLFVNITLYNVFSVHWGCSVHRGISWVYWRMSITLGDIMSTSLVHRGYTMSTLEDVQYIGGISWVHWGMFSTSGRYHKYIGVFNINQRLLSTCSPHESRYLLMYWRSPNVLKISPWCTHSIPSKYWTPTDLLNIPRCTEHTLYSVNMRKRNFLKF